MTVSEFLFQLALLLISFAVPVATAFTVNYLNAKIGNEKLKKYFALAETAVKAAETIYPASGQGVVKKADVEKYLAGKIGNVLSAEDIDKLIQAAVFEIKKAGKQILLDNAPTVTPITFGPFVAPLGTSTTNSGAVISDINNQK